jgi:hypothetical protein
MEAAAVFFALAAAGGVLMAVMLLRGAERPPAWIPMLHGLLVTIGLTLFVQEAVTIGVPPLAQLSLGLLLVAALGGAYLNLGFHQKGRPLPLMLVGGHMAVAVLGFVLLIAVIINLNS